MHHIREQLRKLLRNLFHIYTDASYIPRRVAGGQYASSGRVGPGRYLPVCQLNIACSFSAIVKNMLRKYAMQGTYRKITKYVLYARPNRPSETKAFAFGMQTAMLPASVSAPKPGGAEPGITNGYTCALENNDSSVECTKADC